MWLFVGCRINTTDLRYKQQATLIYIHAARHTNNLYHSDTAVLHNIYNYTYTNIQLILFLKAVGKETDAELSMTNFFWGGKC